MAASPRKPTKSNTATVESLPVSSQGLYLIHGEDDYLVAEEARRIVHELTPKGATEFGVEIIEGTAGNQSEAIQIFKKLFESLQSQSFFATEKVVWLRDTNLFGADRTATGATVSENLEALNDLIKAGLPPGVKLVITATDLDGRKGISKTFQKSGKIIAFKFDPYKQQENEARAIRFACETAVTVGKKLDPETASLIVEMAGLDSRTIRSEIEKIATYAGDEKVLSEDHIRAIGSWRPGGVVWDLTDSIGERDLNKALAVLANLLFLGESPVGLLFAIISRVRLLILLRDLSDRKLIRCGGDYQSFKAQIERLPSWITENLPADKKLNPLAGHPFVIFKASPGANQYQLKELKSAMQLLLETNERLVTSGGDPRSVLEEALIKICMKK